MELYVYSPICSGLSRTLMAVDLLPAMTGDKKWHPEKWSPRHRMMVALHLGGDKNNEIAEKLGVSASHVSITLCDPRAVYEIEHLAKAVADRTVDTQLRIKLYANEALDEIVEELRVSKSEKIRQTAAFGLLDRAGYTPVREVKEVAPPMLPADVIQRMEDTTKELVEYQGIYREVESIEIETEPEVASVPLGPGELRGEISDD